MGTYANDFDDTNKLYFKNIKDYSPLSKEEEHKLFKRYKNKKDLSARDKLVRSNLKYVASVAKHYKGRGLSFSDLLEEGNIGLIKSIDRFDEKKDVKIISYAVWQIKQSIIEAINKKGEILADELPKEYEKQIETNDEQDTDESIITKDEFKENEKYKDENNQVINKLLNVLSKRESEIIKEYFGLATGEEKTLEEIGEKYGLTKERVRQIKEKSMLKLRSFALFNDSDEDVY